MPSTPRYHRRIFGGAYFSHCLFPVADPKAAALAFPSVADCRVFRSSAGFLRILPNSDPDIRQLAIDSEL